MPFLVNSLYPIIEYLTKSFTVNGLGHGSRGFQSVQENPKEHSCLPSLALQLSQDLGFFSFI